MKPEPIFYGSLDLFDSRRFNHLYISGGSGSGKTTLLLNMLLLDIHRGYGVCYIDPHNDPTDLILQRLPKSRHKDVIYFEPTEYPLGLNPLAVEAEDARESAIGDLMGLFKRISHDSWGPQMDGIFRMAFAALIQIPRATIFDLIPLLTDDAIRQDVATRIRQDFIAEFWRNYTVQFKKDAAQPVLLRLIPFITSPTINKVFSIREKIDMAGAMDAGKIVLCNLGQCGQDTKQFLGTALMSVVQSAVMARARIPEPKRRPFYLFVDEFQNFQTSAFAELLREGRKFKIGITLANQLFEDCDKGLQNVINGSVRKTGGIIETHADHSASVWYMNSPTPWTIKRLYPLAEGGTAFTPRRQTSFEADISPLSRTSKPNAPTASTSRREDRVLPSEPPD